MLAQPVRVAQLVLVLVAAALFPARASYYSDYSYGSSSSSSSSFDAKCIGYDDSYYERGWAEHNDLSQTCKTQSSNAHGRFTSLGTCKFQFHHILNDTVNANYMSSACSDDNVIDEDQNGARDDPIMQEVSLVWGTFGAAISLIETSTSSCSTCAGTRCRSQRARPTLASIAQQPRPAKFGRAIPITPSLPLLSLRFLCACAVSLLY
jgi:hypothetical protein